MWFFVHLSLPAHPPPGLLCFCYSACLLLCIFCCLFMYTQWYQGLLLPLCLGITLVMLRGPYMMIRMEPDSTIGKTTITWLYYMQKLYAKKSALPSVIFLCCQFGCLFIPLDFSSPAFTLLHTVRRNPVQVHPD